MARQNVATDKLRIAKNERVSNPVLMTKAWSDSVILTVYSPKDAPVGTEFLVEVSPKEDGVWCVLTHKGADVKVAFPKKATNIPISACYAIRLYSTTILKWDVEFELQAVLDV